MPVGNDDKNIGIVERKSFTFGKGQDKLVLESGQKFGPVTIAYETYGELNKEKSNAILILHALSGDAHVAGYLEGEDKPGWWDNMVGPGKAFDTTKYFVICSNVLGGCRGSTGPSSINPDTGKPYALNFPFVTISDMVNAQKRLVEYLGINRLLCVTGGSMGGMQVLQWVTSYPDMVKCAIPISTALKHSPQQIAFDEVGRQAIMADPEWRNGNYYGHSQPEKGLAVARMVGHITYMSDESMEKKFSRNLKSKKFSFSFASDFEVEGYLRYRGDSFVRRFDANSYLYITKAMDYFDLSGKKFLSFGTDISTRFLGIAFKSDWLYPAYQMKELVRQLKIRQLDAIYCEIKSTYGHDAFLLEVDEQANLISSFLSNGHKIDKEEDYNI